LALTFTSLRVDIGRHQNSFIKNNILWAWVVMKKVLKRIFVVA
jgi:hypothetical protein